MMLFAGVDGGQSGSRAILANEHGAIVARVRGRPLFSRDEQNGALVAELAALLRHARAEASLPPDITLRAVVAGLSGQDIDGQVPPDAVNAMRVRLVHDAEIAHAAALGGCSGIVVIAGSGSVAFGTDVVGRRVRRGGWGALFGDEGSAFWIGRRGVSAAMSALDDGVATALASEACALFGVPTLRALQHAALAGRIAPDEIGSFAPQVLALAQEGDTVAVTVRTEAVHALASLVLSVDRALEPEVGRLVSFAGRVFDDLALREGWRERVHAVLEPAHIVQPRAEPVMGAVMLAYRDAGIAVPQAFSAASSS